MGLQVDPVSRKKGPQEGPQRALKEAQKGSWIGKAKNNKIIKKQMVFEGFRGSGEVQDGPKMSLEVASKTRGCPRSIKLEPKRAQEASKSEKKVLGEPRASS